MSKKNKENRNKEQVEPNEHVKTDAKSEVMTEEKETEKEVP